MKIRIAGVDVGGTFTDLIFSDTESGTTIVKKVPSTPQDQSIGVENGLKLLKEIIPNFDLNVLVHGSTVGTNAILERKGVKTAFITTKGFEDIIEIGRQNRDKIYDLQPKRPIPLVSQDLRFGIKERVNSKGKIVEPLDEKNLISVIEEIKKHNVRAVAVSLLFSFFNPKHEQIIKDEINQSLPNVHVSISSQVLPEFREYERSSTTILDAYIAPIMAKYFDSFIKRIDHNKITASPLILLSNGGVTQIKGAAHRKSVETVLSGLAGGVLGGLFTVKQMGISNALTLDIGGTSTDVACIKDGQNEITRENTINNLPLKIAAMDVQTIGAGGGSIARLKRGIITVGPESAGAVPGPVCYGKGGQEPTVTDANLLLGMFDPDYFCGGTIKIYPNLAKKALADFAYKTGFDTIEDCAAGIIEIYETNISLALRKVSTERGHDPRDFSLIAFGGGGPLHACSLVERLHMKDAIIPPFPGAWSALGLLTADIRHDISKSYLKPFSSITTNDVLEAFEDLEQKGIEMCIEDGFKPDDVIINRSIDVRLKGQSYELSVPFYDLNSSSKEFDRIHEQMYGYSVPEEERILVNLVTSVTVKLQKPIIKKLPEGSLQPPAEANKGTRKIFTEGDWTQANVYERSKLLSNNIIKGPSIIEQGDSTTFIAKGWEARVFPNSHILIRREK